jgi:N-acetylglucosamine-6-phosphate deacetylase
MPDGEYSLGGQPVYVNGNRATLADGTIAGSATNLMQCLRVMVQDMGLPLETAVRCAAVNPAKSIGIYDRYGSIAPGKVANLVLLNQDLEVMTVILNGEEYMG